jgi:hypothetical protein
MTYYPYLSFKKQHTYTYVVTQFRTPRAGDGVYLFWTECRSLAHIRQKIDKDTERNILKPCLNCFLLFLSFPFTTKIIKFS